jgi:hypothetical protein
MADRKDWQSYLRGQSKAAFDAVRDQGSRRNDQERSLSSPRENDGPIVAAKREELREVEDRLAREAPSVTLTPPGQSSAIGQRTALLDEHKRLVTELMKIDKVRRDFNDRGLNLREDI